MKTRPMSGSLSNLQQFWRRILRRQGHNHKSGFYKYKAPKGRSTTARRLSGTAADPRMQRVATHLAAARSIATSLGLIAIVCSAVLLFFHEARRDLVVFHPVVLTKQMRLSGFDAEAVTDVLVDKVLYIQGKAPTSIQVVPLRYQTLTTGPEELPVPNALDTTMLTSVSGAGEHRVEGTGGLLMIGEAEEMPEVQILSSKIPLGPIVNLFREIFGHREVKVVTRMSETHHELRLLIRVSNQPVVLLSGPRDSVEALLQRGAEAIVRNTQPYVLAGYYHTIGDTLSARVMALHCLRSPPRSDDSRAYNLLGILLSKTGRSDDAIRKYEKAIDLSPNFAQAYNNLAVEHQNQGRYSEALRNYRRAARRDPRSTLIYTNWGVALNLVGDAREAIRKFRHAIDLDPHYIDAYTGRADAFRLLGDTSNAFADYEEAVERDKEPADSYSRWGFALFETGREEEAEHRFREAIKADSTYSYAHLGLANRLVGSNDLEARAHYKTAILFDSTFTLSFIYLARTYENLDSLPEAEAAYRTAIRRDTTLSVAYYDLSRLLLRSGRRAEAESVLERILLLHSRGLFGDTVNIAPARELRDSLSGLRDTRSAYSRDQ